METQELMIWQLTNPEPDFELDPVQVHEYTVDIAKRFFCFPCENHWLATFSLSTWSLRHHVVLINDDLAQGKEVMPRSHTIIYQGLVKLPQAWGFVDSRRCNL